MVTERIIKMSFGEGKAIVALVIAQKTESRRVFRTLDDFLSWFLEYRRRQKQLKILVFRGPAPYSQLRGLLITCNLLSQIYKIPLAGSPAREKSKFGLVPILPLYS